MKVRLQTSLYKDRVHYDDTEIYKRRELVYPRLAISHRSLSPRSWKRALNTTSQLIAAHLLPLRSKSRYNNSVMRLIETDVNDVPEPETYERIVPSYPCRFRSVSMTVLPPDSSCARLKEALVLVPEMTAHDIVKAFP